MEERVREALKMGFQRIIIPKTSHRSSSSRGGGGGEENLRLSQVVECKTLFDALEAAFINPDVVKSFTNKRQNKKKFMGRKGGGDFISRRGSTADDIPYTSSSGSETMDEDFIGLE